MPRWSRAALVTLLTVLASGCVYVAPHHRHPRPSKVVVVKQAKSPPSHGHRHRHGGIELVFDGDLGVYLVVGRSHHYFHDARYFRLNEAGWQVSARLDSGWVSIRYEEVPSRLLVLKARGKVKKGKGHKGRRHPAKYER